MRDDFETGRALSQASVDGTQSTEAEHALMHMNKLRRGLLQQPVPVDVRNAVLKGKLDPGLRPVLLGALFPRMAGSSSGGSSIAHTPPSERSGTHGSLTLQSASISPGNEQGPSSPALEDESTIFQPVRESTAKRTNVPRRARPAFVVHAESSSAVSVAPSAFTNLSVNNPTVQTPSKIVSDIATQSNHKPQP